MKLGKCSGLALGAVLVMTPAARAADEDPVNEVLAQIRAYATEKKLPINPLPLQEDLTTFCYVGKQELSGKDDENETADSDSCDEPQAWKLKWRQVTVKPGTCWSTFGLIDLESLLMKSSTFWEPFDIEPEEQITQPEQKD